MVRAIPNGEWVSKASIAQADNTPGEVHVQTANSPFVGETDAMASAEQGGGAWFWPCRLRFERRAVAYHYGYTSSLPEW